MRVLVTGGTGLIGARLVAQLRQRGDQPVVLTRRPAAAQQMFGPACELVEGDPIQPGDWQAKVETCDAVINLAGENIFNRRWSASFKELLIDSRIKATRHVVEALRRNPKRADGSPRVLVNASAIGYYGPHGDEELTEQSPPGSDFLAKLCVEWEKTAQEAQQEGLRVALVRVGIVLDRRGGALPKMLMPFEFFAGGPIGNGRQWMSWIHHEDMVGLFLLGLDHPQSSGPLNGTAPNPVTNKEFAKTLGGVLHRPSLLPAPVLGMRLMLGEVADVVATGQRVLPSVPLRLGYQFKYPMLQWALADIL